MDGLLVLIPLFPLLGVVLIGSAHARLKGIAHIPAITAVALSFAASCGVFFEVLRGHELSVDLFPWIVAGSFRTSIHLVADRLTGIMLLVVTGVSTLIHIYSAGYMHSDPRYPRFFAYLNFFVFSMTMLVLAGDFLLLFVFWEAVGLASYLLIGFWFEKDSAALAGKKAFIVNRIGDFVFALALMLIFVYLGTMNIAEALEHGSMLPATIAVAIPLLLFVGACGKSAQIPLYVWLPDAMEGPTPVSALIHAATMVTAGVYMMVRAAPLFLGAPAAMEVVAIIGCATALLAATIGLVQNDIKKVLAYSTVSQLGYMVLGVGLGAFGASMFHLVTHAFFKACLFLGAGSVIHAMHEEQDIRAMGGLRRHLPITSITFLLASLALAGVPPFAGFWSKDEILAAAHNSGHNGLFAIGLLTAFMTAFYTFRLFFLTFEGKLRSTDAHPHESPHNMTVPLIVLGGLSVVGGFIDVPGFLAGAGHHGAEAAAHGAHGEAALGGVLSHGALLGLSSVISLAGVALAYLMYMAEGGLSPSLWAQRFRRLHAVLLEKWYVDEAYDWLVVRPLMKGARWLWKWLDLGVIDGAVNGAARLLGNIGGAMSAEQRGFAPTYMLSMAIGAVATLAFMLARRGF